MSDHKLYESRDFTQKEYEEGSGFARLIIDGGLAVCKVCGAAEIELDESCKTRQAQKHDMGKALNETP